MKLTLAENIRAFRRGKGLTQEKLAEAVGVTTGAVYKWESGMSVPELGLIVEMADFFDVSVDVLLGYQVKDNRIDSTIARIKEYLRDRKPETLIEAEKALKRYPNSFEVVHNCAEAYEIIGSGSHNEKELKRALELLEHSRLLLSQNSNPEIGEFTIFGEMAEIYLLLGEYDKGIELLKKHNFGGMFNDTIGVNLMMYLQKTEEAKPYLARSMMGSVATIVNSVVGQNLVLCSQGDYKEAKELTLWGIGIVKGLKVENEPNFLDKVMTFLLVLLAHAQIREGLFDEAAQTMDKVAEICKKFDENPHYGLNSVKFLQFTKESEVNLYDSLGSTAHDSVNNIIEKLRNRELSDMWRARTR